MLVENPPAPLRVRDAGAWLRRRLLQAAAVAFLALLALSGDARPAGAHADFVSAEPEPGTGMPQAPGAVVMKFSEPLIDDLSTIDVVGPTGEDAGDGPTIPVDGDPNAMKRPLGLLAPGQYTVRWTTVSPLDGHTLRGSYTFGVGTVAAPETTLEAGPVDSEGPAGIIGRFLALSGLTLWAGAVVAGRRAAAGGLSPQRLRLLRVAAPVAAAFGTTVALVSSSWMVSGSGTGVVSLLSSQSGMLRGTVVVAAAMGALLAARGASWTTVGVIAGMALIAEAASGHAAATTAPSVAIPAFAVHLGAAGVWLFTIVAAVMSPATTVATLKSLAPYAVRAGAVVAVTGLLSSALVLEGLHDLVATGYGRVLSLKIVALAVMAALGRLHHRRRSHHHAHGVRGPLRGELLSGVVVMVLATFLVAFPNPPAEERVAALAAEGDPLLTTLRLREAVSVGGTTGPYVVGLTILPPEPGPVEFRVQVLGVEAGDALRDVRIRATGPDGAIGSSTLESCGNGCFAGEGHLAVQGRWTFDLAMHSNRGPLQFSTDLPFPVPDGSDGLDRALQAMSELDTARVGETLREQAEGGPEIVSQYQFRSPDRLRWAVDGGTTRIGIGTTGYITDRNGEKWETYEWSAGGFRWPNEYYSEFFADRTAVRMVGDGYVDNRRVDYITFIQATYPAWYRLAIDQRNGRILRLEMFAERHVMSQVFEAFNTPVTIEAPSTASSKPITRTVASP